MVTEVQALSHAWQPPGGVLGRIIAEAGARAAALSDREEDLRNEARMAFPARSMRSALLQAEVAIVAEVKRSSPSRGAINTSLSAAVQALAYSSGGASAISVLTEPLDFGGSIDDLRVVAQAARLPVLRKDFIVDELQIIEARAAGAAAVLLIVRALPPSRLRVLLGTARHWGIEAVVEIRSEQELELAVREGAALIGVNNRNLETLELDMQTSQRLLPLVPGDLIAIAESGIVSAEEVRRAAECGADAVLVGSSLSAAADPAFAVRALTGVKRLGRAN